MPFKLPPQLTASTQEEGEVISCKNIVYSEHCVHLVESFPTEHFPNKQL